MSQLGQSVVLYRLQGIYVYIYIVYIILYVYMYNVSGTIVDCSEECNLNANHRNVGACLICTGSHNIIVVGAAPSTGSLIQSFTRDTKRLVSI